VNAEADIIRSGRFIRPQPYLLAVPRRNFAMPRVNLVERRMSRFLREPPSVRGAVGVIVTATAVVVVASGLVMRLVDHDEYHNVWVGMWWALQTVTTVGYGDVTPRHASGRIAGAFVMLYGIAFLTVAIAAITSTFVARAEAEREREARETIEAPEARIEARIDALGERLERIESLLTRSPD
jgi:voltage-gated potassium channel